MGIELTTRQPTTTGRGSMPRAIRIPAGIATAVPNPAMPSMKWPKAHAIKRARTRWSVETLASIFLIFSIAPVSRLRLYVNSAATMTRQIGHSALRAPSSAAVSMKTGLNFQIATDSIAVMITVIMQAL